MSRVRQSVDSQPTSSWITGFNLQSCGPLFHGARPAIAVFGHQKLVVDGRREPRLRHLLQVGPIIQGEVVLEQLDDVVHLKTEMKAVGPSIHAGYEPVGESGRKAD